MKRILSILLAMIVMTSPFCMGAVAVETETNYDDQIAPCYVYVDALYASITKKSLGFVTCTSQFNTFQKDKTYVLTCYLQRCDEDTAWSNYKSESKTVTGVNITNIEKTWFAPAGYAYRTKTVVQVKNSSGTVLETVSNASSVLYK